MHIYCKVPQLGTVPFADLRLLWDAFRLGSPNSNAMFSLKRQSKSIVVCLPIGGTVLRGCSLHFLADVQRASPSTQIATHSEPILEHIAYQKKISEATPPSPQMIPHSETSLKHPSRTDGENPSSTKHKTRTASSRANALLHPNEIACYTNPQLARIDRKAQESTHVAHPHRPQNVSTQQVTWWRILLVLISLISSLSP